MGILEFKTAKQPQDEFSRIIRGMFPFFMLLIYILPISKATERIVSEKETRARESMKIMGMNDTAYWLSWFCFFAI